MRHIESRFNIGGTDIIVRFANLVKRYSISISNTNISTLSNINAIITKIIKPSKNITTSKVFDIAVIINKIIRPHIHICISTISNITTSISKLIRPSTNASISVVSKITTNIIKIIRPLSNTTISTTSCNFEVKKKRTLAYFNGKTFADIQGKEMQEIVYEIIS